MFVAMKTPARSEARRAGMFVAVAMFVAIKHSAGYMICTGCLFFFIGCMSASGKTADNIRSLIPKTVKSKLKNCIGKTVIIISLCGFIRLMEIGWYWMGADGIKMLTSEKSVGKGILYSGENALWGLVTRSD